MNKLLILTIILLLIIGAAYAQSAWREPLSFPDSVHSIRAELDALKAENTLLKANQLKLRYDKRLSLVSHIKWLETRPPEWPDAVSLRDENAINGITVVTIAEALDEANTDLASIMADIAALEALTP